MNSDIRISTVFFTHRKTRKLWLSLGDAGVLGIIKLWSNVATLEPTGALDGWDCVDIAITSEYKEDPEKFVSTLVDIGFLDVDKNNSYSIHNWAKHQPWAATADDRSLSAAKNQVFRWCMRAFKSKSSKEDFKNWYETYDFVKGDTAKRIVDVYESYTNSIRNCTAGIGGDTTISTPYPPPPPYPPPSPPPSPSPPPKETDKYKPEWLSRELWDELIANRKSKKLQNTNLALTTFCNAILRGVEAGYTAEECVGEYVASSWARFNHEWITPRGNKVGFVTQEQSNRNEIMTTMRGLEDGSAKNKQLETGNGGITVDTPIMPLP